MALRSKQKEWIGIRSNRKTLIFQRDSCKPQRVVSCIHCIRIVVIGLRAEETGLGSMRDGPLLIR